MPKDLSNLVFFILYVLFHYGHTQEIALANFFANCHMDSSNFDECIKDAINDVRPFFKEGLPQYGVGSFDPFFAEEVTQIRGGPGLNYKLKLRNVTEAGWTVSKITDVKTDFSKHQILLTHSFPDKRLKGKYEFVADILGNKINLKGNWNLNLFDYVQKMTVSRVPRSVNGILVYDTPIKVDVKLQTCQKLELHISDLLGGRRIIERVLDQIINVAWPPGFYLLRPVINDLVSTAFTKIFDDYFRNFPFDQLIR